MMKNNSLAVIQKKISPVIDLAHEIVIRDSTSMTSAVDILSTLNTWNDQITAEKEKVTKPLNEALKAERGRWKPFEVSCESAIEDVRRKMIDYQTAETARVAAEQKKIADKVVAGKLSLDTAVAKIENMDTVDTKVLGDLGNVFFVKTRKFEVVSLADLPLEYHLADEAGIRAKMKEGVELPGVKYYTEEVPRNNR